MELKEVELLMTVHADFPSPGIMFRNIFPILRNPTATRALVSHLISWIKENCGKVDVILGLEARGFLLGPILALELEASFVPLRKAGKLPGEVRKYAYQKEYGQDVFEVNADSIKADQRVVVFDDLIATGGSAAAAVNLIHSLNANAVACVFIVELLDLKGTARLPATTKTYAPFKY